MNALMENTVPGFSLAVFKRSIAKLTPLLEQGCGAVLLFEMSGKRFLEAAAKDHRCPRILFTPAIQVPVAIAARATQVVAQLGIAVNHRCSCARVSLASVRDRSSHSAAGANASRF